MKPKRSTKKSAKATVGVRLEEEFRVALSEQADERNVTVSDMVRYFVIQGLREDAARGTLFEAISLYRHEIQEMRKDLALMAEVLLCGAGKLDESEAREWAQKNIAVD